MDLNSTDEETARAMAELEYTSGLTEVPFKTED